MGFINISNNKLACTNQPVVSTEYSAALKIVKKATSPIVAGRAVKPDSDTHVSHAFNNGVVEDAFAIGVAENSASIGQDVTILLLGVLFSTDFLSFNYSDIIILGTDGHIVTSSTGYNFVTNIGRCLGSGSVLININPPTEVI